MLIPTVPFHSHPRLPQQLPQSPEAHPKHTISYHFVNYTSLPSKDVPEHLLLSASARSPSVQLTTDTSISSSINHGSTPYNSAANHDSPSLVSPNVSAPIALNNIRLRTTSTTYKPLPAVLPPVPSIPSTSAPLATTATQSSTIPLVPLKNSATSALRLNYQKMLAKKKGQQINTMPPPLITRIASTESTQTSQPSSSDHMDSFMDLGSYSGQSGEYPNSYLNVADRAAWQCASAGGGATRGPASGHIRSTVMLTGASLVHPAVTSSPALRYSSDSLPYVSVGFAGGDIGSGGESGGTQVVLPEPSSAVDFVGGTKSMTMEDLLEFLNTPPTPSLHQPPPTPLSQSSTNTSPLLFDNDEYSRILNTPLDPLQYSPGVVSQASPYQTSPSLTLLEDLSYPLFFDSSMTVSSPTVPNALPCSGAGSSSKSSTINPTSLGLSRANSWGSSHPSSLSVSTGSSMSPPTTNLRPIATLGNYPAPRTSTSPTSTSAVATTSSAVPIPNGIRKNVKPADLLPVDAPIQPRNYITPSATSRREVPPSVARTFVPSSSRKRSATAAGMAAAEDMQDELAEEESDEVVAKRNKEREGMDPEKRALLDHVEASRKRNTLAARKSRQRKLEHVRGLEELVERLQAENDALRSRVEVCETRLRDAGLDAS
ncbi:hypothetical protein FRB94_008038 [Tulasnella sp. JGI-2019a]|nr:hypothetical protein FRB94_008038 [Tulasnella sp. JGI-2019a]